MVNTWFSDSDSNKLGSFVEIMLTFFERGVCDVQDQKDFVEIATYKKNGIKIANTKFSKDDFIEATQYLTEHWAEDRIIHMNISFPIEKIVNEETSATLTLSNCHIRFIGTDFCSENTNYGDIEIAFENVADFFVRANEYSPGQNFAEQSISANFISIIKLVEDILISGNPQHLLITTSDTEPDPISSHLVFHRNWNDFKADLEKIALLHVRNGTTVTPKQLGYLRIDKGKKYAEKVSIKINELANFLSTLGTDTILDESEVKDIFCTSDSVSIKLLETGIIVYPVDGPKSYVEEPYLRMFDTIRMKNSH